MSQYSKTVHDDLWRATTFQMDVNGALLTLSSIGPESGIPIILLHGGRGFGTHDAVFATYANLAGSYRVIGFDMRGHGRSETQSPFTFAQMVDDIECIRRKLCNNRKIILLGGSFGGMIALSYAITHPNALEALILRGTAPSWHHEQGALENFKSRAQYAPMATEKMLEKVFTPTIVNDEEFRLIMFAIAPLYEENPDALDRDRLALQVSTTRYNAHVHNDLFADHSYDVTHDLKSIPCPTLVMCGANDWICPKDQSERIARDIPHAELKIIPNTNHAIPSDVAYQLVSNFLSKYVCPL